MVFILSDEALEALKCSSCKKYLSVKPIKVYPDNQIKCGRCSKPGDKGAVSLYGILAKDSLFKCINRFDGCNKLLTYSEVRGHEQECLGSTYLCPICGPTEQFATFLLPDHFEIQHPNECLGNPELVIDLSPLEAEQRYFYKQYDCLFIINAKISQSDDFVGVNVSFVGKEKAASKILHRLSIYSSHDRQIIRTTEKRPCQALGTFKGNTFEIRYIDLTSVDRVICKFEIDTSALTSLTVLPQCLRILEQDTEEVPCTAEQLEERLFPLALLSEDFKIKYPGCFISDCGRFLMDAKATVVLPLFCFTCHRKLIEVFPVVYKLRKNSEYLCGRCAVVILEYFSEKIVIDDDMFDGIDLMCRWGCGSVNRVNHNCESHPLRICPLVDCEQVGTLDELVLHFQEKHELTYNADSVRFFSHELLESQTVIFLVLNRFVVLDISVTSTTKMFTMTVIDKQYSTTGYTPIAIGVDFHKGKIFKHDRFFSINIPSQVFFVVTLTK